MISGENGWVRRPRVNLPLDRDKPVPLARQIQAQLERLIRERLLAPGTKLPATRELARTLGVNRAPVALAYAELFPAPRPPAPPPPRTRAAPPAGGRGARPPPGPGGGGGAGDLVRRRHARQRALPDRRLPPRAEPGRARGGREPAPVLPGGRLPAPAPVPLDLPAALRARGAAGRHPDRQRLAAGLRPARAHPARPGRRGGDRAADVPARAPGLPLLRRPARAGAVGRGRAARRGARAAARAPGAQALLLPALRS